MVLRRVIIDTARPRAGHTMGFTPKALVNGLVYVEVIVNVRIYLRVLAWPVAKGNCL
jgi:hypothetical protein